jgi:uncharacterized protein (TIGR00251 family)
MLLSVKVIPKAREEKLVSFQERVLKVKIREAPEKGKANQALIDLIARVFEIKKSRIKILRGERTPEKFLEIGGLIEEDIRKYFLNSKG